VGLITLDAAAPTKAPEEIRARAFTVVDATGRTRAQLISEKTTGNPLLALVNQRGEVTVTLAALPDGSSVLRFGKTQDSLTLGELADGKAQVFLKGSSGGVVVDMSANPDGSARVTVGNASGEMSAAMAALPNGMASLGIRGKDRLLAAVTGARDSATMAIYGDKQEASLGAAGLLFISGGTFEEMRQGKMPERFLGLNVDEKRSGLSVFSGKGGMTLEALGGGESGFELFDGDGKESIKASVKPTGLSGIAILDRYGKAKAVLGVNERGEGVGGPIR